MDFETVYKLILIVCCVAVSIAAVISLVYFLRAPKKDSVIMPIDSTPQKYHIYENTVEQLANGMDNLNMVTSKLHDMDLQIRNEIEILRNRIDTLEHKVNDLYIEE